MSIINMRKREICYKIVYYGPSLGGKTTNIEALHGMLPDDKCSGLQQVDTDGDRTLFFDQFDLSIKNPNGMGSRFQIYGVPGQSYYRATRKMVLQGVDGIVFVVDSQHCRLQENFDSLEDMQDLLMEHGNDFYDMPLVIQYNKQDLDTLTPIPQLEKLLNKRKVFSQAAIAVQGQGVQETFKAICKSIMDKADNQLQKAQVG